MADEENNSEEVAKETTLQDMVEQLSESNVLQKSLQESSLKTTEVLTSIAKILQAQLDMEKSKKLDEGRDFDKPSSGGGGSDFKFDKLEMPTSVADGLGMAIGALYGSVTGFFSELRLIVNKGIVDITKVTKKLKNVFARSKLGQMFKGISDTIKGFLSVLRNLFVQTKFGQMLQGINNSIKTFFGTIGSIFKNFNTKISVVFAKEVAKMRNDARFALKVLQSVGGKIAAFFNFFIDPIRDMLKMIPKPGGGGVVSKSFEAIGKFFKMFHTFFRSIGRVLARVAYPITIVMGLFEAVNTAIEDFDSQKGGFLTKFIAGAFGFIKGAVSFMITDFLDLIKSAVSWIIEKIFGEDNPVSEFLDSFSFTELFQKGIDIIRDFFLSIPKYFENAFAKGGGVFGMLGVFAKDILGTVTHILGFLGEILGKIGDYVMDKIPEPLLKMFGITRTPTTEKESWEGPEVKEDTAEEKPKRRARPKSSSWEKLYGSKNDELSEVQVTAKRKEMMQFESVPTGIRAEYKSPASALTPLGIDRKAKSMVSDMYGDVVSPLLEASTGGSAVNQGTALQDGTSNLKDAKSKSAHPFLPIVMSNPNNSQTTNSTVTNNHTVSNTTPWDAHDPMTRFQPGTANW